MPANLNNSNTRDAAKSILFQALFADSSAFTEKWATTTDGLFDFNVTPWVQLYFPAGEITDINKIQCNPHGETNNEVEGTANDKTISSGRSELDDAAPDEVTEDHLSDDPGEANATNYASSNDYSLASQFLQREQTFNIRTAFHGVHSCRVNEIRLVSM